MWRLTALFGYLPGFVNEFFYRAVARRRYRVFGRRGRVPGSVPRGAGAVPALRGVFPGVSFFRVRAPLGVSEMTEEKEPLPRAGPPTSTAGSPATAAAPRSNCSPGCRWKIPGSRLISDAARAMRPASSRSAGPPPSCGESTVRPTCSPAPAPKAAGSNGSRRTWKSGYRICLPDSFSPTPRFSG